MIMVKRKVKKSTRAKTRKACKVTKAARRKSTIRRRQPRNPFEINNVPTLI